MGAGALLDVFPLFELVLLDESFLLLVTVVLVRPAVLVPPGVVLLLAVHLRGVRQLGVLVLLGLHGGRDRRQQGRLDARRGESRGAVSASGTPYFARRSGIIDSTGALRRQLRPKRAWRRAW